MQALAGREVWILEDNDKAGAKRAQEAAEALHGTAKTIRIVRLPDLPELWEHAAQDCIANVTIWPFRALTAVLLALPSCNAVQQSMQRPQRFLDNQDDDSVPSRPRTYMAKRHGFFSSSGVTSMSVARSRVHCSSVIGLSLIMYFPSTCSIC